MIAELKPPAGVILIVAVAELPGEIDAGDRVPVVGSTNVALTTWLNTDEVLPAKNVPLSPL